MIRETLTPKTIESFKQAGTSLLMPSRAVTPGGGTTEGRDTGNTGMPRTRTTVTDHRSKRGCLWSPVSMIHLGSVRSFAPL